MGNTMSEKKLHYGVRLRVDQLKYLKEVKNRSEWIRKAIDEKRKREQKMKIK
jgi:metal-responsive CopG/Arc/MetJ family transcriptional regulator